MDDRVEDRVCEYCGRTIRKNKKLGWTRYHKTRFCSVRCRVRGTVNCGSKKWQRKLESMARSSR